MAVLFFLSEYYFFDVRDDGWGLPRTASMCIIGGRGGRKRAWDNKTYDIGREKMVPKLT